MSKFKLQSDTECIQSILQKYFEEKSHHFSIKREWSLQISNLCLIMYYGEVNVAHGELNSFLAVDEDLQVKDLTILQHIHQIKQSPSHHSHIQVLVTISVINLNLMIHSLILQTKSILLSMMTYKKLSQ